jgi:hypothetical protein
MFFIFFTTFIYLQAYYRKIYAGLTNLLFSYQWEIQVFLILPKLTQAYDLANQLVLFLVKNDIYISTLTNRKKKTP